MGELEEGTENEKRGSRFKTRTLRLSNQRAPPLPQALQGTTEEPHAPPRPRPRSRGGALAHLSSPRRGSSACCRPGRLRASGAGSSPRPAGRPPGTAPTCSARRPHSWPCTARNTCVTVTRGCWRLTPHHFRVSPPPRLLRTVSLYHCEGLARFWINPRCGQRKAVPQVFSSHLWPDGHKETEAHLGTQGCSLELAPAVSLA